MIAKEVLEKYGKLKTKKDKEPFRMTEEEMRDEERILQLLKIRDDEEYRKTSCKIEFSCSDLRDRTNQKRLTNGEIFKLVEEFKKQIESYLEEAEEAGFINAYEDIGNKEGKDLGGKKDITYFIDKVDRWPRK